jgi:CheY-like chemotaxis protein
MRPGIDGIEFCRRLRAYPATTHVPVNFIAAASADMPTRHLGAISRGGSSISPPRSTIS